MGKKVEREYEAKVKAADGVEVGVAANSKKTGINLNISAESESKTGNIITNTTAKAEIEVNSKAGINGNVSFSNEIYRDKIVDFSNEFLANVGNLSAISIISMTNVLNTLPKGSKVKIGLDKNGGIFIDGIDYNAKVEAEASVSLSKDLLSNTKKDPNSLSFSAEGTVGKSVTYIDTNGAVIAGRIEFNGNAKIDFNLTRFIDKFKDMIKDGLDSNLAIKMKIEGSLGVSLTGTYYKPPLFSYNAETGIMDVTQKLISGTIGYETKLKIGGSIEKNEKGEIEEVTADLKNWRLKGSIKNKDIQNPFDYICSTNQVAELKAIEYNIKGLAPYAYKVPDLNYRAKITSTDILQAGRIAVDAGVKPLVNNNPKPVKFINY